MSCTVAFIPLVSLRRVVSFVADGIVQVPEAARQVALVVFVLSEQVPPSDQVLKLRCNQI